MGKAAFITDIAPDWRRLEAAARNRRPAVLPLYEHVIDGAVMDRLAEEPFSVLRQGDDRDLEEYFRRYCRFLRQAGYDCVIFESALRLPHGGAILDETTGPIQNRADFEAYEWDGILDAYRREAFREYEALEKVLPPDMKVVGGVGCTGVFEMSEDLVGLACLPFLAADDPELHAELYVRLGEIAAQAWSMTLERFGDLIGICRLGDDLGFRTSLLTMPDTVRELVLPQHRRIIDLAHAHGKPLIFHSCGCIFEVMEDIIANGIDAKHSNEDAIAPYSEWIGRYGDRIGLFGGIDVNIMTLETPDRVRAAVLEQGRSNRAAANGYALGTGHSITPYIPAENYLALLEAADRLRHETALS